MSMSQQDYSDLISQSVDVASTMTFEMTSSVSKSLSITAGMAKGAANLATKYGGPKAKAAGAIVNVALSNVGNETVLGSFSSSSSKREFLREFARNSNQADSAAKISEKTLKIEEFVIGGVRLRASYTTHTVDRLVSRMCSLSF